MAWSSAVYTQTIGDILAAGTSAPAFDMSGSGIDTFKVALYGDGTPDKNSSAAASAYASTWQSIAEKTDGSNWPAGGVAIPSSPTAVAITVGSGFVMFDGSDVPAPSAATLAAVFGCNVYDDTLTTPQADQGVSFHSFGGTQTVTGGAFTVVFHANGIFRVTT